MIVGVTILFIHPQVGVIMLVEVDMIVPKGGPLQTLPTDATSSDLSLLPITLVMVLHLCRHAGA